KRNMKRKGFTLVELLIVIVVIGILSAMMMLSSTEAVSSAKASNIVSNLRNMKTAALAYYVDNVDTYDSASVTTDINTKSADILKYLGNSNTDTKGYKFTGKNSGTWFVYYDITNDANVRTKLAGRAKSTGLIGANSETGFTSDDTKAQYGSQKYVGMFIR
ncbi:MAG: type II secretion system protein, partial [Synergistaceae bacterium]|nr:type II secretion system protein [Synergistaceae bacterium]